MKKINLEVRFKRYRFGYWNSCKRLPNFVNVAALITMYHDQTALLGPYCLQHWLSHWYPGSGVVLDCIDS